MNDCKISVHCSQTALLSWRNVHLFINHTLFILNIIILFKNSISLCFHGNSAVSVWMGDQEREKDGVTKAQMVKLSPKLKISRHHMMSRLTGINEWCERLISAADVPENTSHDESFNIWTSPHDHTHKHTPVQLDTQPYSSSQYTTSTCFWTSSSQYDLSQGMFLYYNKHYAAYFNLWLFSRWSVLWVMWICASDGNKHEKGNLVYNDSTWQHNEYTNPFSSLFNILFA